MLKAEMSKECLVEQWAEAMLNIGQETRHNDSSDAKNKHTAKKFPKHTLYDISLPIGLKKSNTGIFRYFFLYIYSHHSLEF